MENDANGSRISFRGDESVLKLIVVMVVKSCDYDQTIKLYT
jgi:hypothetical protein